MTTEAAAGGLRDAESLLAGSSLGEITGVDARALRLDVELAAAVDLRDLVLSAGGEDWKFGVDFNFNRGKSGGGATSASGRTAGGLVSGIASPVVLSSGSASCVGISGGLIDGSGRAGAVLGIESGSASAFSSTSDWVGSSSRSGGS